MWKSVFDLQPRRPSLSNDTGKSKLTPRTRKPRPPLWTRITTLTLQTQNKPKDFLFSVLAKMCVFVFVFFISSSPYAPLIQGHLVSPEDQLARQSLGTPASLSVPENQQDPEKWNRTKHSESHMMYLRETAHVEGFKSHHNRRGIRSLFCPLTSRPGAPGGPLDPFLPATP